jgi:ornithine cyclodeaminase/alanine dehydrogenase-like protein (mu-crystallin family)
MPDPAPGTLRVLSTSDIATVEITPAEVISVVEQAYQALADGRSDNPRKLSVTPDDGHSVAYAMLARDGARDVVAVKTSYKHDPAHDRTTRRYYTSLTLYDDSTGLPIALMDCGRIGALRTPAVSALLARHCAPPGSRTALLIGTGTQGRQALPFLLETLPGLERLLLSGTHPDGIEEVRQNLCRHHPDREVELVTDLATAAADADVVLATAGAATPVAVTADWLKPGALSILVGHGLAPSTAHRADHIVATSAAQMTLTGTDMADEHGNLPRVHAELPEILAGRAPGRAGDAGRVFAYNSGLVITDIALGHRFAELAINDGLGQEVTLWR